MPRKSIKYTVFLLGITTILNAQAPSFAWQKHFGGFGDDWLYEACLDAGNQVYLAGYSHTLTSDSTFQEDAWLLKFDADSSLLWEKRISGSANERFYTVDIDDQGDLILAGVTQSDDGNFLGNNGSRDVFVSKVDTLGSHLWTKLFGGSGTEVAHKIIALDDGYLVVGLTTSSDGDVASLYGFVDYWLLKLDFDGNLVWEKTYGGTGDDRAFDIVKASDGGFFVVGHSDSQDGDVSNAKGSHDIWLIKIDAMGHLIWEKSLGGSFPDYAYDMCLTANGGLALVGETSSSDGDVSQNNGFKDAWIVHLDSLGNILWEKSIGGDMIDFFNGVHFYDNKIYATGRTFSNSPFLSDTLKGDSDILLIQLDTLGNVTWYDKPGLAYNDLGESFIFYDKRMLSIGVTEIQDTLFRHGNTDAFLVAYDLPFLSSSFSPSDNTSFQISLFPNPNQGNFILQNKEGLPIYEYQILDVFGRVVLEGVANDDKISISLRDFSSGQYWCHLPQYHLTLAIILEK